jgi:hypothetical protein
MSNAGSIYYTKMPPQSLGTLVEYFVRAKITEAGKVKSFRYIRIAYFYYVRTNDTMSIKDIQYTQNNGGFRLTFMM